VDIKSRVQDPATYVAQPAVARRLVEGEAEDGAEQGSDTRRASQPLACWKKTIEKFRVGARLANPCKTFKDGSQSSYTMSTKNGIRHKKYASTRKALAPERL
jgi:hypothetical protein